MKNGMTIKEYHTAYYRANRERIGAYMKNRRRKNEIAFGGERRRIRDARKERGYTQVAISKLLGIPQPTLSQIENGQMSIASYARREELLSFLGLILDEGGVCAMPMNSCFNCTERHVGCHAKCEKYIEWQTSEKARKDAELRIKIAECEMADYIKNGRIRAKRKAGER